MISKEDQTEILIYAMRYAIGRATYAPHVVAHVIAHAWPDLSDTDKFVIQRDIREAISRGAAGMDIDVAEWKKVLELPLNYWTLSTNGTHKTE
jgi:hypothetical protein